MTRVLYSGNGKVYGVEIIRLGKPAANLKYSS